MAKGFKHGSGGSNPLNFKVICNPKPENARENTIWVDTDRINNYYFSATQPENMEEYDVWFPIGTSSPVGFNAVKKNGIQVYPQLAKQYVGGAFIKKDAMSYQDGQWENWRYYLFKEGIGSIIEPYVNAYTSSLVTITKNFIVKTGNSQSGQWASVEFKNIDLINYSKVCWEVNCTDTGGASNYAHQYVYASGVASTYWSENSKRTIYTTDISSVNEITTVGCSGDGSAYTIYNVWLEP